MASNGFELGLDLIGDFIVQELRNTLGFTDQNHNATGNLSKSIRHVITKSGSGFEIAIWAVDYAKQVDEGQPKKTRVSIDVLLEWMENRGIARGEPNIRGVAFAIQTAIWKEGTPTAGSLRYSRNKKRTEFIKVTLDANAKTIFKMVLDLFQEEITLSLSKTISKNKRILES